MAKANSILFDYTCQFYALMKEESKLEQFQGIDVYIYRGSLTSLFRQLAVSQSYYSRIKDALTDLGCTTLLKRGSRNVESVVVLHHEPTREAWEEFSEKDLTQRLDSAILSQRVQEIIASLGGLDVKKALADHEIRITNLEREVERIGRTPTATRKSK